MHRVRCSTVGFVRSASALSLCCSLEAALDDNFHTAATLPEAGARARYRLSVIDRTALELAASGGSVGVIKTLIWSGVEIIRTALEGGHDGADTSSVGGQLGPCCCSR